MRLFKALLVTAVVATGSLAVSSVGDIGAAQAKAHAKKGSPGRCGVNYYYSKKEGLCLNALLKK